VAHFLDALSHASSSLSPISLPQSHAGTDTFLSGPIDHSRGGRKHFPPVIVSDGPPTTPTTIFPLSGDVPEPLV